MAGIKDDERETRGGRTGRIKAREVEFN